MPRVRARAHAHGRAHGRTRARAGAALGAASLRPKSALEEEDESEDWADDFADADERPISAASALLGSSAANAQSAPQLSPTHKRTIEPPTNKRKQEPALVLKPEDADLSYRMQRAAAVQQTTCRY